MRADINLDRRVLYVRRSLQQPMRGLTLDQRLGTPKTPAAIREVPLRPSLATILEAHLSQHWRSNRHDFVFPGRGENPLNPNHWRNTVYTPAIERSGLHAVTFHGLRAVFVTHAAEAGVPVAIISRWVGHNTERTTEIYLHATRHAEADAIKLLDHYDANHAG